MFMATSASVFGQNLITGSVFNELNEPLFGATILWEGTDIGTVVDEDGTFEIIKQTEVKNLVINYVGYDEVLIEVAPEEEEVFIQIDGITDLMEVEVAADIRDNYVSTISTLNIETIGCSELRKAPCCNLAESFQTNVAVDVSYNDAVTGAKEIMLLGLRGTYTQMTVEKRPAMTGLGSAFAMGYTPGTWLESIQIIKGQGTVANGYQAIAGQINTELVKPFNDKQLFVNLYGSSFGRGEVNVHLNKKFDKNFSAGLMLHASKMQNQMDDNDDGFYDTPQKELLTALFRSSYRNNMLDAQFNIHAVQDRHNSGQIIPQGANPLDFYQINQNHDRVELFSKLGYLGLENQNASIGFIGNASWHRLDSYYGNRWHRGEQQNFYGNLIYSSAFNNPNHRYEIGASYMYDDYDEQLDDTDFSRTESVPGVYAEYTYSNSNSNSRFIDRIGIVAGVRVDHHNLFGTFVVPRANVKYNFSDESIIRASAGRGLRYANVIAENVSMLASNRAIVILEDLEMEDAWNYGINFTQRFKWNEREASFAIDAFHTNFTNQVIRDMDANFQEVQFYNLDGKSFANSILGMFTYEVLDGLDVKLGYKFNDVKMTFQNNGLRAKPMVARHRGLVALDYVTPNKKWEINTNMQLVGQSRFADLLDNPAHTTSIHAGDTPAYALVNGQVTHIFNDKFEVYAGMENITSYVQEDPIIDAGNPFGDNFDANHIYAPITGRMAYLGIRYGIE